MDLNKSPSSVSMSDSSSDSPSPVRVRAMVGEETKGDDTLVQRSLLYDPKGNSFISSRTQVGSSTMMSLVGRGKTLRSLSLMLERTWDYEYEYEYGYGYVYGDVYEVDMDMNMIEDMNKNMHMNMNTNMVTFSISGNHWENIYLGLGLRKIAHCQYIVCKLYIGK